MKANGELNMWVIELNNPYGFIKKLNNIID